MAQLRLVPLAVAGGATAAAAMLILSIFAAVGWYGEAYTMMRRWHVFYDLSAAGVVAGMLEAAIITALGLALFGAIYNRLERRS